MLMGTKMARKLFKVFISLLVVVCVVYIIRQPLARNDLFQFATGIKPTTTMQPFNDGINNLCASHYRLRPNSRVLSYSIFGTISKYYDGIPLVVEQKRNSSFYKEWQIRIYHDGHVPNATLDRFKNDADVLFCDGRRLPRYGDLSQAFQMFWRFVPIADPSVDVFCSRDLDSAILTREEDAVGEFLNTTALLHTMRDHFWHDIPILGGMWCFQNKYDRPLAQKYFVDIIAAAKKVKTNNDQPILNEVIWKDLNKPGMLETKVVQHDSYKCKKFRNTRPFPRKRISKDFYVGCNQHDCRTTQYKLGPCPVECRPSYGKDWQYC